MNNGVHGSIDNGQNYGSIDFSAEEQALYRGCIVVRESEKHSHINWWTHNQADEN